MADSGMWQRPDGLWIGRVFKNGKRYGYSNMRKSAVKTWVVNTRADVQSGRGVDSGRQTFGDYAAKWLIGRRIGLQPTTFATYEIMLRLHVIPTIGSIQLKRLTPADLRALYGSIDLVPSSVRKAHRLIHKILSDAVGDGDDTLIRNVAQAVKVDVPEREKKPILTMGQTQHVLDVAQGHPLEALYSLLAGTGMRLGEALALKWSDLDLDAGTLSISRSLQHTKAGNQLSAPKTRAGVRSFGLAESLVRKLSEHRTRQASAMGIPLDSAFIFCTRTGNCFSKSTVLQRWYRLCDQAGVPRVRLHDLRHGFVTHLRELKVQDEAVSALVGHSSVAITLALYGRSTPAMQDAAIRASEIILSGDIPKDIGSLDGSLEASTP